MLAAAVGRVARGREPLGYTQVRPNVVVQLDVDTAFEQDRWRYPTVFRRLRPGLRVTAAAAPPG